MRKVLGAVLVALLIPAALAAQKPATPGETRMATKKGSPKMPSDLAASSALTRVRSDLAAGKLNAWGGGQGGGIRPTDVTVARTLYVANGGKDGGPVYLVFTNAAKRKGQVRVALNAETGAILNVIHKDWAGFSSPDWWLTKADEPHDPNPTRR